MSKSFWKPLEEIVELVFEDGCHQIHQNNVPEEPDHKCSSLWNLDKNEKSEELPDHFLIDSSEGPSREII